MTSDVRAEGRTAGDPRKVAITVLIPVYNRARELPGALDSVVNQMPIAPTEILVVDDGSTDGSGDVAQALGARVIRHARNRGLAAARNTGVAAASQPWVALLDSDDRWCPHHLSTLWALRDGHVLVAASALWCGEDGRMNRFQGTVRRRPVILRSARPLVYPGNFITVSAAMARRDVLLESGGFVAHHGVVEDLHAWCRVLERGTGIVTPTVSVCYALHATQMSADYVRMHRGHAAVVRAHAKRPWSSSLRLELWRGAAAWDAGRAQLATGDRPGAVRALSRLAFHPARPIGLAAILVRRVWVRRRSRQWTQATVASPPVGG